MKQILLSLFILISFGLNAQIQYSPADITLDTIMDLSDEWISAKIHASLENNTNDPVSLRFEITSDDAPSQWEVQLCVNDDTGGCFSWGITSNVDAAIGIDVPLNIIANGSSIMDLGLRPNGVLGCGSFDVAITTVDDPTTVLAIGTYNFKINTDPNCETVSTSDFDKAAIKIFPNPTNDYFTITDNNYVRDIEIFNIVGKRMKVNSFQNGQAINVTSYPNGLYLVRMLGKNGEILKTTRLTKR